jgi:hypothetical protein
MGEAIIFSIEYRMPMMLASASVARSVTVMTLVVMSGSHGTKLEKVKPS